MKPVYKILNALGDVVHALQKERGCAALFLDSNGKIFANRRREQARATDDAIEAFLSADMKLRENESPTSFTLSRLADAKHRFDTIVDLRDRISRHGITYTEAINQYTFSLNVPLLETMAAIAQSNDELLSPLVTAWDNFLQWKERVGRERALGARGFHTFAWRNPEFRDRMLSLMAEQDTYLNSFMSLASPKQIEIVRKVVDSKEMKEVLNIHKLLVSDSPSREIENFSGEQWFDMTTCIIDQLRIAEGELVNTLAGSGGGEPEYQAPKPKITANQNLLFSYLRPLSLFSSLSDDEINELTAFARIKEYSKGNLLFLQGEPASRIYIVLSGWLKVFNGLESGEETILQMLTAGETLLESAVILNTSAPASAQVVEDAVLLSIPAPVIRQRIQSSNTLAVSMLNNVSLKSQMLIYQMEQNRLKSARERVGWFLLRLRLSQGGEDGKIHLPYDKATIASYLNMRPETFSRALKKMREEGLEVSNDEISYPSDQSLCKFCDSFIANDCSRAGTEACPHPEFGDDAHA